MIENKNTNNKKIKKIILFVFLLFVFFTLNIFPTKTEAIEATASPDIFSKRQDIQVYNSRKPENSQLIIKNGVIEGQSGDPTAYTTSYQINIAGSNTNLGDPVVRVGRENNARYYAINGNNRSYGGWNEVDFQAIKNGQNQTYKGGRAVFNGRGYTFGFNAGNSATNFSERIINSASAPVDALETMVRSGEGKCISWGTGIQLDWCAVDLTRLILKGVSWLYEKAGRMMDLIIKYTVLEMHTYIGDGSVLKDVIDTVWKFFRDLGHIVLVFALLYLAIMIIINGNVGDNPKILVTIILMAILLNFSMLFTKLAIDASNLLTVQLYQKVKITSDSSENKPDTSGYIASQFALQSYADNPGNVLGNAKTSSLNQIVLNSVIIVFMTITIIIFLFIAVLFISRFIVLIILMMTSSIYFATQALPQTKGLIGDKWKDALVNQCLFAPIFMILYWASLKVIYVVTTDLFKDATETSWSALLSESSLENSILKVLSFLICIGMLIASIVVAKQIADKAGEGSSKLTGFPGKGAGKATFGLAGWMGRNSLGRLGATLSKLEGKGFGTAALKRTGRFLSGKSYDFRGTKMGGKLIEASGFDMGEAGKKWSDIAKAKQKAHKEMIEDYSDDEKRSEARLATLKDKKYLDLTGELATRTAEKTAAEAEFNSAKALLAAAIQSKDQAQIDLAQANLRTASSAFDMATAIHKKTEEDRTGYVKTNTDRGRAAGRAQKAWVRDERRSAGKEVAKELKGGIDKMDKLEKKLNSLLDKEKKDKK